MNFKGYVQVSPTEKQIESLKEYIRIADNFISDSDIKNAMMSTCLVEVPRKVLFWDVPYNIFLYAQCKKKCPYGIGYFHQGSDKFFYRSGSYKIMKALLDMYNAGDPLYLDNEMCRVWNRVKGK